MTPDRVAGICSLLLHGRTSAFFPFWLFGVPQGKECVQALTVLPLLAAQLHLHMMKQPSLLSTSHAPWLADSPTLHDTLSQSLIV